MERQKSEDECWKQELALAERKVDLEERKLKLEEDKLKLQQHATLSDVLMFPATPMSQ